MKVRTTQVGGIELIYLVRARVLKYKKVCNSNCITARMSVRVRESRSSIVRESRSLIWVALVERVLPARHSQPPIPIRKSRSSSFSCRSASLFARHCLALQRLSTCSISSRLHSARLSNRYAPLVYFQHELFPGLNAMNY